VEALDAVGAGQNHDFTVIAAQMIIKMQSQICGLWNRMPSIGNHRAVQVESLDLGTAVGQKSLARKCSNRAESRFSVTGKCSRFSIF
jgi:hypothetical protein